MGDLVVTESFYVSSVVNAIANSAGAVQTVNIADANVTAAKLASGAARSNFGAGAVLQVYTVYDATGGSTTNTTRTNISTTAATITPTSTSSKLVISVTFIGTISAGGAGVNSYGNYDISEGSTAITAVQALSVVSASGTNVQVSAPCAISYTVTNSALTARSFYLYASKTGGTATVTGNYLNWTIMEVAV